MMKSLGDWVGFSYKVGCTWEEKVRQMELGAT